MKPINYSNGGSGKKTDSYRPLGLRTASELRNQYPNSINPFKIPLAKNFISREDKYTPRNRYKKIDKHVNLMLGMAIGDVMLICKTTEEIERLMKKCKNICPKGAFEIVEEALNGIKIKCTSV